MQLALPIFILRLMYTIAYCNVRNVHIIRPLCLMCTEGKKRCIVCTLGKFFTLGRLILPNMNVNLVSNNVLNISVI